MTSCSQQILLDIFLWTLAIAIPCQHVHKNSNHLINLFACSESNIDSRRYLLFRCSKPCASFYLLSNLNKTKIIFSKLIVPLKCSQVEHGERVTSSVRQRDKSKLWRDIEVTAENQAEGFEKSFTRSYRLLVFLTQTKFMLLTFFADDKICRS